MTKKQIWISEADSHVSSAQAALFRDEGYEVQEIAPAHLLGRITEANSKRELPDLLIVSGTSPGQNIIPKMQDLGIKELPIVISTGSMKVAELEFPGMNVSTVTKFEPAKTLLDTVNTLLSGARR